MSLSLRTSWTPRLAVIFVVVAGIARVAHADLSSDCRTVLKDKALAHGEASVTILKLGQTASQAEVLFKHDSDIPLAPASNLKLVSTSAFLDHFGSAFKFRTLLVKRGDDVAIVGDADPSFGDAELLKKLGWETTTVFHNWSDGLKKRGINAVRNVLVDDSICDENFVNPDWPVKQQHLRYVAGVGGLNFNANALDFYLHRGAGIGSRVSYTLDPPTKYAAIANDCLSGNENAVWLSRVPGGNNIELRGQTNADNAAPISVTIHDPGLYGATVFSETLQATGVRVNGTVMRDDSVRAALPTEYHATALSSTAPSSQPSPTILAIHETPIATVLARANKDSMNLYAEAMCKRLGWATSNGQPGSWENGDAALGAFLEKCGVTSAEFSLVDGCGLAKKDNISSNALAHVLAYDFASANHDAFLASLSVAGVDGTLDNRFRDSDLRGRVFAKSGYISGVSALSGFVHAKDNQWYAFSIVMNSVGDIATCKQLQERIVKAIDAQSATKVAAGQ